jgi:TfoX/Sxy family transcriptional regulator of competence genes
VKFPKSPPWLIELFDSVQPEVGGTRKQMFGYPCAFENGQLFAGLFGDGLFVRVSETDRAKLLAIGAEPFAPMGRESKKSIVLPRAMLEDKEAVKAWLRRALVHAQAAVILFLRRSSSTISAFSSCSRVGE